MLVQCNITEEPLFESYKDQKPFPLRRLGTGCSLFQFRGLEFLHVHMHKQGSLGYMTGEVTRGSHSFKPDVVCSDSAALCDWEGALLTWEVTLWCYQELVCFYKLATAVWEHLIARLSLSKCGPLIISRPFGPCSLQEQDFLVLTVRITGEREQSHPCLGVCWS